MESKIIIITEEQLKNMLEQVVQKALCKYVTNINDDNLEESPFGDIDWLCNVLPIPELSVKQKSSKGLIPGKIKIGKRVIYDKATVINWVKSHY